MEEENHQEREKRAFRKGMLSGMIAAVLLGGIFLLLYGGVLNQKGEHQVDIINYDTRKKLQKMETLINTYFLDEIDGKQVEDWMYKGLMAGLDDPYAAYYSEEELENVIDSLNGYYKGIGAIMSQDRETGVITVVKCYEGTPAEEGGLLPGDVVLKMNDLDTSGMELSELVREIKTGESDEITMVVQRNTDKVTLTMTRRVVDVPTVSSKMLEQQIGYIQISEFDDVTPDQFAEAKKNLEEQGMEKLIVDLRNNPGGNLKSVISIMEQILPEGMIVYTEDKYGNRTEYQGEGKTPLEIPLAVLINGESASAAEIFAGAVKDYGIGTLVGTTTFGKGIVQRQFALSDGTAIKLTVAKYYTPKGNDIHEKGVEPDVEIELEEGKETLVSIPEEQDNQLQKAIEILEEQ